MGKFSKIKKSKRISSSIEEKINLLNKELVKTGMLSEITNSTSGVYTVVDYTEPEAAVAPTLSIVPDTTGITGDSFTQPTYGGVEGDNSTWDNGWSSNDYLKNPNELAGETNIPIVASVPDSPYDSGGAGIALYYGYFGTSVGYAAANGGYKQILVGSISGGTENPDSPTARSPLQGGYYGGLTDAQYAYAVGFWRTYRALVNKYGPDNLPGKSVKVWVPYNRFHHFQSGGEFASWTGGPKKSNVSGSFILQNAFIITEPNKYTSDPGSPYQPGYTTVLFSTNLGDPNYYPGPIPSKIGNKWGLSAEAYNQLIAGYGLRPDGNMGFSKLGDKVRGNDGKIYELVPRPGYGYNQWVPVKGASQPTKVDDKLAASYPTDTALDKLIKDTKPGPGSGFRGLYDMQGYPIDPKTGRRLKGA